MNDKVVYRHLKPCGEVFYIGIGTKKRPYKKVGRSKLWTNTINKYGYEVQILKEDLSWEEAVELECILIDYYGRIDIGTGTLVNFTDGGDGALGYKYTEEHKTKMSEAHKGKTHSEETKAKISGKTIVCTETGMKWYTIKSCAEYNNINPNNLKNYLSGRYKNKTTFIYLE